MAGWVVGWLIGQANAAPVEPNVLRALSSRDPVSCAAVEALTATPQQALEAVLDTVTSPPWAPMRAAQCLLDGYPTQVQPRLEQWVADPALKGLGRLVLGQLDRLPEPVAVAVAQRALSGSDPVLAADRIRDARSPAVRALVTP